MISKHLLLSVTLIASLFAIPASAYLVKATYSIEFDSKNAETIDKIKQAIKDNGLPLLSGYENGNATMNISLLIDSEKIDTFKNNLETISKTICPIISISLVKSDNSAICIF